MAINIEDIMSEIRSDIQEKGLNSSMLSFADVPCDANPENPTDAYDPDTLRSNVQYVSTQYQISHTARWLAIQSWSFSRRCSGG